MSNCLVGDSTERISNVQCRCWNKLARIAERYQFIHWGSLSQLRLSVEGASFVIASKRLQSSDNIRFGTGDCDSGACWPINHSVADHRLPVRLESTPNHRPWSVRFQCANQLDYFVRDIMRRMRLLSECIQLNARWINVDSITLRTLVLVFECYKSVLFVFCC